MSGMVIIDELNRILRTEMKHLLVCNLEYKFLKAACKQEQTTVLSMVGSGGRTLQGETGHLIGWPHSGLNERLRDDVVQQGGLRVPRVLEGRPHACNADV